MPSIPPPSRYCGLYLCSTDDLIYSVSHTDSKNTTLLLRRRRPSEPDWRPGCTVEESHLKKLLEYKSFIPYTP